MITHNNQKLMTINETAKILGVTRQTISNRINQGKYKAIKLENNWYVPESLINQIIAKKEKKLNNFFNNLNKNLENNK